MTDKAVLETRLKEAETALHTLRMGQAVVRVKYEDHETEFSRANVADLRRYINELKAELGLPVAKLSRRVTF